MRVAVIGAGIGGLCLAQGLRQAGIDVAVYERDASPQARAQGYRISLRDFGAGALRGCLPAALFELAVATSIRPATKMIFMDEHLRPKFAKPIPAQPPGLDGFGVNRLTLREILLAGLDRVTFGKQFARAEHLADGRVRAHFTDGSSADAEVLVGADGTYSAVRAQLVPDAEIELLDVAIYGRTPIGPATLDWLPAELTDSFNRVIGPDQTAIAVATCRTATPVDVATARVAPSVRLTDIPGYLSWTFAPPASLTPLDADHPGAAPERLHALVSELVSGWHPAVRRIVAEADIAATFPVAITSARPVRPWPTSAVTVLGDAIHTMSPGRGEGAGTALRDAALLRDALVEAATGTTALLTALSRYEAEMLEYGFAAVQASLTRPFRPARRTAGR